MILPETILLYALKVSNKQKHCLPMHPSIFCVDVWELSRIYMKTLPRAQAGMG